MSVKRYTSRLQQLWLTARLVIREDGWASFAGRLFRWVRGERGYWIERFVAVGGTLQQYPETFEDWLAENVPPDSPYVFYPAADRRYQHHIYATEPDYTELAEQRLESQTWGQRPLLSIVTPVFRPPLDVFRETVASVLAQTYEHWHWHVVDASPDDSIWQYLQPLAAEDPRIKLTRVENRGISENTNIALKQAEGDFIVVLDHDDTLASHALFMVAKTVLNEPEVDFIYSDHDKLDEEGKRREPWFRPDWSPEMMLSVNYVFHLAAYRRTLLDEVGYLNSELDVAQDWDLYLRISEHSRRFEHISQVLYHWRMSSASTAQYLRNKQNVQASQSIAVRQHLERRGLKNPQVTFKEEHPTHWMYPIVRWEPSRQRRVSIVIPSKDNAQVVGRCLKSIFSLTTYPDFEVILVDTGSTEPATHGLYRRYASRPNFRVVDYTGEFNFSRACNVGAEASDADVLLFLNNDTEVLEPDWLDVMVQWFEVEEIGAIGVKLLYPDGRIQHAGVIVGMGGLAGHLLAGYRENVGTEFGSDDWYRDLYAVTGACLMIPRSLFEEIGGFDEGYQIIFSDIDLCLRVYDAGYRVLYTPNARLRHHEFGTRDGSINFEDFFKASRDHLPRFLRHDRHYNINLSYAHSEVTFSQGWLSSPTYLNARLRQTLLAREKKDVAPPKILKLDADAGDGYGINFAGDLQADLGLGDSSRALVKAAQNRAIGVNYIEVPNNVVLRTSGVPEGISQDVEYPVTVIHENPQGFHYALSRVPSSVLKNRYVTGVWYWELPEFPEEWHWTLDHVDEIWVTSRYVQDIFAPCTSVPVMKMPLTIDVETAEASRGEFGLPDDRFVFTFSFSPHSSVARKNPFGYVEAFRRAFGRTDSGPLLVLKVHYLSAAPAVARPLAAAVESVGGVLLDVELTRLQMNNLLNLSDCYVSLHRAEGFGLGMAEAMALGKPVIATGYSGNADFMTPENSYPVDYELREIVPEDHRYQPQYERTYPAGQIWAEPDVDQAAEFMRRVYENRDEARERGARARQDIATHYSLDAQGAFIESRLQAILAARA